MESLEKAAQLKAELDSLRLFDAENEARVMQKLRLDWNYHSNKLEGNSYTYGETKMLLFTGRTAGGKPQKDSYEITGHNEAIDFIFEAIEDKSPMTEMLIRHLHQMILVKPYYSDAVTSDRKPTRKLIQVGEYKTTPNHVETETGEEFRFAEPIETPAEMQKLLEWFREKKANPDTTPILFAAEFHYRFVRIHPFDDGNGRMARLLMNFVLMQYGYPPVIIKTEDKQNYIAALTQSDFGILEPFVDYIAINLADSLKLMIRGVQGEDIEEPEDLDKELALLEKRLNIEGEKIAEFKKMTLLDFLTQSIPLVLLDFLNVARKFDRFYSDALFQVKYIETGNDSEISGRQIFHSSTRTQLASVEIERLSKSMIWSIKNTIGITGIDRLKGLIFHYKYIVIDGSKNYENFTFALTLEFDDRTYLIKDSESKETFRLIYSKPLTSEVIAKVTKIESARHLEHLQKMLDNPREMTN